MESAPALPLAPTTAGIPRLLEHMTTLADSVRCRALLLLSAMN